MKSTSSANSAGFTKRAAQSPFVLNSPISHVSCRRVANRCKEAGSVVKGRFTVYATPSVADVAPTETKAAGPVTVGDVMTKAHVFFARPSTTINEALEILVHNSITGLPVIDEDNLVVGVVSDFDLLTLDTISGERETSGMFPDVLTDWKAFEEVQKLILKNHGSTVEDVMTADPITVNKDCSLEKAARMLLDKKIRRLPVVDASGKLEGMFSRADVIKAALRPRSILPAK